MLERLAMMEDPNAKTAVETDTGVDRHSAVTGSCRDLGGAELPITMARGSSKSCTPTARAQYVISRGSEAPAGSTISWHMPWGLSVLHYTTALRQKCQKNSAVYVVMCPERTY